jgi:hypothetical protein
MKKPLVAFVTLAAAMLGLTACTDDDSDVVDHNITKAAKNFEVQRRIVVINGITDAVVMQVEGRCNVEPGERKVWFTCKVADGNDVDSYIRNQVYTGDNVIVAVEQGEPIQASAYHYRFTYKPQSIIPDPDFRGSMGDTPIAPENQQ